MATASVGIHERQVIQVHRHDRMFYGGLAAAMAITAFAGFARTYYGPLLLGGTQATLSGRPWTTLVHTHGALFTTWVVLFFVQTTLIASRRVSVHRKLGVAGAVLAAGMVVAGTLVAAAAAARGSAPPGVEPLQFLTVPLTDMVLFSGFIITALVLRRDKEAHKRLMLLAYVSIIAAATARLPGILLLGPPAFFGLALSFVVAGMVYDFVTRRRIHPVYWWGGGLLVISVPARLALSTTAGWQTFAQWLTATVG